MPPPGGYKRKRGDRSWSAESSHDGQRPSPHRPDALHLAQHSQVHTSSYGRDQPDSRGRGARQSSRGLRGSVPARSPTSNKTIATPSSKPSSPEVQKTTNQKIVSQTNGMHSAPRTHVTAPPAKLNSGSQSDPDPHPRPLDYSYITDDVCKNWETTARASMLEKGIQLRDSADKVSLGCLFQELLWAGILGRLPPSTAGNLIKDITWAGSSSDGEMAPADDVPESVSDCQRVLSDNITVLLSERTQHPQDASSVIQASGIPLGLLRQELDVKMAEKLGLVRNNFGQMVVRKTTNLLYRQANFNLLREESEGFAKLMTELFSTSGNEPPTAEVVEDTVERVKALIGSFDLDVGRALDVVLDVFGAVLVKQFRFFVRFLRASPWWPRDGEHRPNQDYLASTGGLPPWALPGFTNWVLDDSQKLELLKRTEERDQLFWARARAVGLQAFYEIGRQRVAETEIPIQPSLATITEDELCSKEDFIRDWVKHTGTIPPRGNKDAAQLLGFKLRFYSSSMARTENDSLPDNLIYLSALLIKVGFISLKDLYAHLWRTDDEMETLRHEKLKEKAERERAARPGQGAKNALLMAGALADDTPPAPTRLREPRTRAGTPLKEAEAEKAIPAAENKDALPEPADQKVPLLKSLLAIGALPESLFILGKFPWIVDVYAELPEYINRILHHALCKVYVAVRPAASNTTLQQQKASADSDITATQKGYVKLIPAPPRKVLRWALLDKDDSGTDGLDYRFYWDEWSDNIPICQTVDDVFTLCDTLVNLNGIKIGQDPALLVKFARIGKHSIAEDRSESNCQRWVDLCKRLLVPALSLTSSNPGVVNEVYGLLSNFSIETRYIIYQEWSEGRMSRSPDMKAASEQAKAETRDTLKRLSKTNVRPMARALAKIAYSNPHIVINTAIAQIEVYDNLAEVFVEGARYFTDLGYDILTWSLMSALGRAGRSRVQESGLVTSRWLTALALFAGKMFKRYTIMRPAPVLQYVTDQLLSGNSTDLIVLEQVIYYMAGIVTDTSYNDGQLLAMGGGDLLRSQTILQLLDKRHESRVTSRRLMRSLKESDLAGKLLLAVSSQRQLSIFNQEDTNPPLKLLGNLYDEIHRVLTQYLDLLQSNLSSEEFESAVPDVCALIATFKVQPEIAFWISRPTLARRIAESDKGSHSNGGKRKTEESIAKDVGTGDVDMADQLDGVGEDEGETFETEPVTESAATPTPAEINGVASNPESPNKLVRDELSTNDLQSQHWHPVLQPVMKAIQSSLPTAVSTAIGLGFYTTFWQLALYDVAIPGKSYEDELSRQHKRIAAISSNRADVTAAGARKREAEKKQISTLIDMLLKENKDHLKAFGESKARLSKEKDWWFPGMHGRAEQLNSALMEHCFLPRILLSPLDALFCFKFLKFLHTSGTGNFRTMGFYDLLFRQNRLTSLIFTCTAKEADNLGKFLNEILRDLIRWQKDKTVYEKEAWGSKKVLPGFARKLGGNGKPETFLHYEDFRRLLFKWHQLLFMALQICLSSSEYMHIRNAITVLNAVTVNFPAINFHGNQLQKLISTLGESRQGDIRVPSKALMGALNKAEKSWILPQAFRKGQEKTSEISDSVSKPSTTPGVAGQPPNAKAADLKEPTTSSSGDSGSIQQLNDNAKHLEKPVRDPEIKDESSADKAPSDAAINRIAEGEKISYQQPKITSEVKPPSTSGNEESQTVDSVTPSSNQNTQAEIRKSEGESTAVTAQSHSPLPRREPASSPRPAHMELPSRPELSEVRQTQPANPRMPNKPSPQIESSGDRQDGRGAELGAPSGHGEGHREPMDYPHPRTKNHEQHSASHKSGRDAGESAHSQEVEIPTRLPPQEWRNRVATRESGASGWEIERSDRNGPSSGSSRVRVDRERFKQEWGQTSQMAPPQAPSPAPAESPSINPERAALIGGGPIDRNGLSIRGQGEERPPRSSRTGSPPRDQESRTSTGQDRRDERVAPYERRMPNYDPRPRDRHDTSAAGSGGARNPYPDRPLRPVDTFPRDLRHQPLQSRAPVDMNHGRLTQDDRPPSRYQEQSSDRSEPAQDIPSGPRNRNLTTASPHGTSTPSSQAQASTLRVSSGSVQSSVGASDRSALPGPGTRRHVRSQSYQEQQSTSVSQPDTSGVHPDRLALVSPSAEAPPPRLPSYTSKQPPVQTSPPSVPSGPRGNAPSGAPSGPAPAPRGPSSGPQGNGRNNRHPLAAVNNTLQQAGQGQSIRGRGGSRMTSVASLTVSGTPNSVAGVAPIARSEVSMPPSHEPGRPDLISGRGEQDANGRGPPPPQGRFDMQPDRPPPSGRRGDLMNETREERRTSSRHSDPRRARSPDAAGVARRSEREQTSRPARERGGESYRSERGLEDRDVARDQDGDGRREDRRRGDVPERDRPLREAALHRRSDYPPPASSAPPRGNAYRDGHSHGVVLDTPGPLVSSTAAPTPSSTPLPSQNDERGGRRRGYPSGPAVSRGAQGGDYRRGASGNDRDLRDREAVPPPSGARDIRDGRDARDSRGGPPVRESDDHRHHRLPPGKHPRADDPAPYGGGVSGRGGNRMVSESKRPRRGGS